MLHRGRGAEEGRRRGRAVEALLEAHVLGPQRAVLGGALDEHREVVGVEGLDDVVVGPVLHGLDRGLDRGVGGHEHDGQLRVGGGEPRLQLEPVHARHLDVEEGHVVAARADEPQRLLAALGHVDLVPVLAEPGAERVAHDRLVVHDQDPQRAGGDAGRRAHGLVSREVRLALGRGRGLGLPRRQVDGERGAAARLGLRRRSVPWWRVDDAVDDGEAEPDALARLLGREERLEDAVEVLLRDAPAGVGDHEPHAVAVAAPPRSRRARRPASPRARSWRGPGSPAGPAPRRRRPSAGPASTRASSVTLEHLGLVLEQHAAALDDRARGPPRRSARRTGG